MKYATGMRTMLFQSTELRDSYHKILNFEYSKYNETNKLQQVFFTLSEIKEKGLTEDIIRTLEDKGFIIPLGNGRYRSLIMDVAFRASDIRIKYEGTKYILESELILKERPLLKLDYIKFGTHDKNVEDLKKAIQSYIHKDFSDKLLNALILAGVNGLSKYQFHGIMDLLFNGKDAIISAPTAFGKTYIFILPILIAAIKAKLEKRNDTIAVIFYPRKSLGSDQMGRLIKLIYHINKECNLQISIGIDDGDVKLRKDLKDFDKYRGIKCPVHNKEPLVIKNRRVFCRKCNESFNFIRLAREDFEEEPPTILITNIWAYQYRLINTKYWKNGYLSASIEYFVFDEVHAYRSIVAGTLRYFIKMLRQLVSDKARLILSSATIPKLNEFIQDITGEDMDRFLKIIYDEKRHGKDAEKIEVYLLIGINPLTSWETYTHELAIFLSTVNRIRKTKNFQSLIFIDGIRNISRLYTQAFEAIELGDPKDHLLSYISPENPFCYWIYNEDYKISETSVDKISDLQNEIRNNIDTHYSDKDDRFEIEEKIKEGNIDVVFTTSTLELGVDYDKVSVIVNAGIPFSLESIIQRVGRAGRDENNTLNTSLCIIVVRNNPLEYYYLYKGIDKLTEIENLPKIPVSASNLFVILYSALLYVAAYLIKNGKLSLKSAKMLEILEKLVNYVSDSKHKIIRDLNIELSPFEIERELGNVRKVIQFLKEPNIDEKLKRFRAYEDRKWLLDEFMRDTSELEILVNAIKEKVIKLNEREKLHLMGNIRIIEDHLKALKTNDLSRILDVIPDLIEKLDYIKNFPKSDIHPLYEFRTKLGEFSYKFTAQEDKLQNVIKEKYEIEDEKGFLTYFRAEEIYQKLRENNLINVIEAVIGFKFMGNEFIDQAVTVGSEFQYPTEKKEMFLTDIISRTPPFELITIPFETKDQRDITKSVGARHFWIIKPQKGFFIRPKSLFDVINERCILQGEVEKIMDMMIPQQINFIDLLSIEEPILIKMETQDRKPLFIKYGSENIAKIRIDGKFHLYSNIKRLYFPDKHFEYIKDRTLSAIGNINEELKRKGNKWGLNFRYPSLCFNGYCISTDPLDKVCPVHEECRGCNGEKFWYAAKNKRKIFPKFHLNLKIRKIPSMDEPLLFQLGTMTYSQLTEPIEFIYDSVTVYLPVSFRNYLLREIKLMPMGYLARTSLVYLCLNDTLVDLFVKIVREDRQLNELLKFKYFMILQYEKWTSHFDAAMQYKKYNSSKIDDEERFHKFVKDCLMHTLAHLFFLFLASKIQIDPEKITYFVNGSIIYVLENSKNDGMGLVETIRNEIEKKGADNLFSEFMEYSYEILSEHEKHILKSQSVLKEDSQKLLEKIPHMPLSDKIVKLQERIKELNNDIRSHVDLECIDIVTYRHILSREIAEWEEFEEELSEYLLPLIYAEGFPRICVDGCEDCLIFYRGCLQSFTQNYTVSKSLILNFIKFMKEGSLSIIKRGIGEILEDLIRRSKKIIIETPFIDDYGYSLLANFPGKDILIITRNDNPYIAKLLEKNIHVRTVSKIHSKLYYFESENEKICIHGSVNLTRSSFYDNKENIVIIWNPLEVERILNKMCKENEDN